GPATASRWLDAIESSPDPSSVLGSFHAPASAKEEWSSLLQTYGTLRASDSDWPSEMDALLKWYEPQLVRLYDDAPIRKSDLVQLRRIAAGYSSRERFLTELTLDPPAAAGGMADEPFLDEDYVILSTIHSAK